MATPLVPRWFRICLWIAVIASLGLVYAGSWLLVI